MALALLGLFPPFETVTNLGSPAILAETRIWHGFVLIREASMIQVGTTYRFFVTSLCLPALVCELLFISAIAAIFFVGACSKKE